MKITTDTDRDELRRRISAGVDREDLRTSNARRHRLQRSSQRRTRNWDLKVEIDEDHPTAHVDQSPDLDGPEVVVTGNAIPQPVSDYDGREWDWLIQRSFSLHEDGHVLYTDHDSFKSGLDGFDKEDKGSVKEWWNALEDGAIEKQLTARWRNYYKALRVARANLFEDAVPGIPDAEKHGQVYPVAHVVMTALLDLWTQSVYDLDLGRLSSLVDPDDSEHHFACDEDREIFMDDILPLVEDIVPEVLTTGDPVERNGKIFDFCEEVLPFVDQAQADGKAQMNRNEGQSRSGLPDDASDSNTGDAEAMSEALNDMDPDDIEIDPVDDVDPDNAVPIEDLDLDPEIEETLREEISDQAQSEANVSDRMLEELEQTQNALDESLLSDRVELPTDNPEADEVTYASARDQSRVLARILRNRLEHERATTVDRGRRRGRFTGRGGAASRAVQGHKRVKEQKNEPDEPDRHFVFVLDRSGSMGSIIKQAEEALGMLMMALEEVGVETKLLELYDREVRLAKPFGVDTEEQKEWVFHNKTGGGTPLADAADLARARLDMESDQKVLVMVTDDEIPDTQNFDDVIGKCTMPTVGVNLTVSPSPTTEEYDRSIYADPREDLQQALIGLAKEVMF